MNKITKTIFVFTFAAVFNIFAFAQTGREKGIESYKTKNFVEAIRLFNQTTQQTAYKNDAEIWNYLGLAYINQKQFKSGQKAFEKAVKFAPQSSIYRANLAYSFLLNQKVNRAQSVIQKAIQLDPKNANAYYIRGTANLREGKNESAIGDAKLAVSYDPKLTTAYILLSDSLIGRFGEKWLENRDSEENLALLMTAVESLNNCVAVCPKDDTMKIVSERLESVSAFHEYFKKQKTVVDMTDAGGQNVTPLTIISKPKPKYTDEARQQNVEGEIKIAIMFGADGKTKYLMPIKGLGFGLTEQALIAAGGIEFTPQKVDDKPVAVVKMVIFTFDIY